MKIEQINQEIIDETYCLLGFGNVHRTAPGIHRYRTAKQWFSVDRHIAYDVTPHETMEDKTCHRFTPVVVGGCTFHSLPDEGRCGMLTIWEHGAFRGRPPGIRLIWGAAPWIRTTELKLDPVEVTTNIVQETMDGDNVFFPKPAGWV